MAERTALMAIAALLAVFVWVTEPAAATEHDAVAGGDAVVVNAVTAAGVIARSQAEDPALRLDEYTRELLCGVEAGEQYNADCSGYDAATRHRECEGLEPVPPVWHRHRDTPTSPWQRWHLALGWTCPQDAVPVLSGADFRRLPIAPSVLTIQPPRDEVFVNMPTIVYTDPAVQTFTTTVLGIPFEVEASPTRFTWDFGDDSDPIVTTSPGHPYPDHDVSYPYPFEGTYTITLTTEFTGRYRLAGSTTWLPVVGTATTSTPSRPITAVEHHTHLVDENCFENPNGPWC